MGTFNTKLTYNNQYEVIYLKAITDDIGQLPEFTKEYLNIKHPSLVKGVIIKADMFEFYNIDENIELGNWINKCFLPTDHHRINLLREAFTRVTKEEYEQQ